MSDEARPEVPAPPANRELTASQHEVQRLLGRCLLRLQQYEKLMKAIVAHHEISASGWLLVSDQERRIADTAGKTLGSLVGALLGTCVTGSEPSDTSELAPQDTAPSFTMKTHLQISAEDFERTQNGLKELVQLRNDLVHHFIDQHDLRSLDGCLHAHDALNATYQRVDQHFKQLRCWAEHFDRIRQTAAEYFQSDAFHAVLMQGVSSDDTVRAATAGVEEALHEAAAALAVDGWTQVALAGRWILERFPEHLPTRYGCSSWRQVIHESRFFELRYRVTSGQRAAWYRVKETPL